MMPPFTNEKVESEVVSTVFNGMVIIAYTSRRSAQYGYRLDMSLLCTTDFNEWNQLEPPETVKYCYSLFSFQGHLYGVFRTNGHQTLPAIYMHVDMRSGEWIQLPKARFPKPLFRPGTIVWKGALWAIGGGDGQSTGSSVQRYSLDSRKWLTPHIGCPEVVGDLHYCKAMIHRGQLHVAGGVSKDAFRQSLREANEFIYTFSTSAAQYQTNQDWHTNVLPPTPLGDCGVLSVQDCPVVAGGCTFSWALSGEVYCIDTDDKNWLQLPGLTVAKRSPSLVHFGDKLVAIGGCRGRLVHTYMNTVEVMQLNFWSSVQGKQPTVIATTFLPNHLPKTNLENNLTRHAYHVLIHSVYF